MLNKERKRKNFQDFLNRELPEKGWTHWVTRDHPRGCSFHEIGVKRKFDIVIFRWGRIELNWSFTLKQVAVAIILQEPDSPIKGGYANQLKIQVMAKNENGNGQILPKLQRLAKKFEKEFGMKSEIISNNI